MKKRPLRRPLQLHITKKHKKKQKQRTKKKQFLLFQFLRINYHYVIEKKVLGRYYVTFQKCINSGIPLREISKELKKPQTTFL